ncbi:GNAT family N-acetyltransferase [Bacillus sp. B190/17]|uniref:GNAT family N-acetyltransferase n=1 Tax=Bacillus lumedeiriae TaxID=3058829 RepID=A0ABW8I6W6_9BACI
MKVIYEGKLNTNDQLFNISRLSMDHIDHILSLQQLVIETLEKKDILQPLTLEEFQYILQGQGLMIGAFVENKLIAFRALMVPPIDEEHLGRDIGLKEEELPNVIYQEISNVHPDYRGNGLQKMLAVCIMKELKVFNQEYSHVCCTVAPFNIPSLKDKFAQGMEIAALKVKYSSRLRYIFVKALRDDHYEGQWEITTCRMEDTDGQQELLKQGWRGFRMDNRNGVEWVDFRRKRS